MRSLSWKSSVLVEMVGQFRKTSGDMLCTSTLDFQLRDRNYNVLQNLPNISFVLTFK